ncbi:MAG: hypothetical protein Q8911_15385 [Bacillota bacterium]|nr:hypothetical protein [Bacillota bacterium]
MLEAFDVLFVLILCFSTLFATMVVRGKVLAGSGSEGSINYSFNWPFFSATALVLLFYFFYVILHSDKELRAMIRNLYDAD